MTWADTQDGALHQSVSVSVPLVVRQQRPFAVQMSLLQGGKTIAHAGLICELPPCSEVAEMNVPAKKFSDGAYDGPYFTIEVFSWPDLLSHDAFYMTIDRPVPSDD